MEKCDQWHETCHWLNLHCVLYYNSAENSTLKAYSTQDKANTFDLNNLKMFCKILCERKNAKLQKKRKHLENVCMRIDQYLDYIKNFQRPTVK